jgi:hypothetical protein
MMKLSEGNKYLPGVQVSWVHDVTGSAENAGGSVTYYEPNIN